MTREEFEYQKMYGMGKVIKWGTYTDAAMEEARAAQEAAMEEAKAAQEAAMEEARATQAAAEQEMLGTQASQETASAPETSGGTPHMMSFPMTANVEDVDESTLTEAELFARELEKKQASRIQDDVLGMVAAIQAQQSDKDREAEEIAARAMAQAEDRIQDNVARLFAEQAAKEAAEQSE